MEYTKEQLEELKDDILERYNNPEYWNINILENIEEENENPLIETIEIMQEELDALNKGETIDFYENDELHLLIRIRGIKNESN